jgi:hypothetical protein
VKEPEQTTVRLDDSYRGTLSLSVTEDNGEEVWLDMVDYEARFGRKALDERLADAGFLLIDYAQDD